MAELEFIKTIKDKCEHNESLELGIGDDCAIICDSERKLVTVDMLSDKVHFDTSKEDAYLIGRKSLAVSLSDIAAMGGVAKQAYIAINIDKKDVVSAQKAMQGIIDLAAKYELSIAGGDTNSWDGPLVISTTVIGYSHDNGPVKRSGAQLGDVICVTGPLGGSIEGRHLSFEPRLREAKELMDHLKINAMIDLSDGLAKDLKEICERSSLGALLDLKEIPLSENIRSSDKKIEKALTDGEDFELCLTLSKKEYEKYLSAKLETKLFPIGEIIETKGIYYQDDDKSKRLEVMGYTHIF